MRTDGLEDQVDAILENPLVKHCYILQHSSGPWYISINHSSSRSLQRRAELLIESFLPLRAYFRSTSTGPLGPSLTFCSYVTLQASIYYPLPPS
jgi:hypothetical protein